MPGLVAGLITTAAAAGLLGVGVGSASASTGGFAGHQLYQWYCNGASGQQWRSGLTGDPIDIVIGHNIYNTTFGLDVDIYGNSPWPGTGVDAWYQNGGANQSFSVD